MIATTTGQKSNTTIEDNGYFPEKSVALSVTANQAGSCPRIDPHRQAYMTGIKGTFAAHTEATDFRFLTFGAGTSFGLRGGPATLDYFSPNIPTQTAATFNAYSELFISSNLYFGKDSDSIYMGYKLGAGTSLYAGNGTSSLLDGTDPTDTGFDLSVHIFQENSLGIPVNKRNHDTTEHVYIGTRQSMAFSSSQKSWIEYELLAGYRHIF